MSTPPSNDTANSTQTSWQTSRPAPGPASGQQPHPDGPANALDAIAKARDIEELERVRRALEASASAAYHWNLQTDELRWNVAAGAVLDIPDLSEVTTGRALANISETADQMSRYDTITRSRQTDGGAGVYFCIEYSLHPAGRDAAKTIWVEESGRWFAGSDGKPREVYGTIRRIDDRHAREEQLEYLGFRDPLTGMMNRSRLSETLGKTIERCKTQGGTCGLLIVVINNLAVVNDAYGFDIADEVIVSIGQKLKRVVRQDDKIARYSGAKFAILLNQCSQIEIEQAAERFLRVGRDSVVETEKGPVWALLSIGGIFLPRNAGTANAAMACAEEALAEAKRNPNDGFVIFEPSPERVSVRDLNARCAAEIVAALRQQRLTLAYQPVVGATSSDAVMYEALLRMNCDDGSVVAANHLIPIAEKLGLVRLIDQMVVKMAMHALHRFGDASIAVNISGATAMDQRWFQGLSEEIAEQPELAHRMVIEINEAAILRDIQSAQTCINRLKDLGCYVAIDDFGAGFSAFRNLKSLNVDYVKLDGTYCEQLSTNPDNQYFVRSLIELAKKFGIKVIAEWVETEEDATLLREFGVDYLQGNLFGEALIIDSIAGDDDDLPAREELFVLPTELSGESDDKPFDASALTELSNASAAVPTVRFEKTTEKLPLASRIDETDANKADITEAFEAFMPQPASGQSQSDQPDRETGIAGAHDPVDDVQPFSADPAIGAEPALPPHPGFAPTARAPESQGPESQAVESIAIEPQCAEPAPPTVAPDNAVPYTPATSDNETPLPAGEPATPSPAATRPEPQPELEPFVPFDTEPDLSRLKSAMSALNADFSRDKPAVSEPDAARPPQAADIDLAGAISRRFAQS